MPFNRAQRDWVRHASRGTGNTIALGSTRSLNSPGTTNFVPAAFPPPDDQFATAEPMQIGSLVAVPYIAKSERGRLGDLRWSRFRHTGAWFHVCPGCIRALKCNRTSAPRVSPPMTRICSPGWWWSADARRYVHYAKSVIKEEQSITHSVDVAEPRLRRRRHVRIVQADGSSIPFNKIRPSCNPALPAR